LPDAPTLLDQVAVHGPWIIFLLTILETSFVTGILVPSGVATALATGIALEEGRSVVAVALAALAGGAIGDTIGFWIGRFGREHWLSGSGRLARRVRDAQHRSAHYLSGRPFLSVTLARCVSFVRTLMPLVAGMSGLTYPRYLTYELLGLVLWCSLYVAIGAGLGEGWIWVFRLFGLWALALLAAIATVVWLLVRAGRKRRRKQRA
jgi:membrane-associated protein